MKKGLLLFFICIIFLFSLHVNAYVVKAEEKTISIVGEYYEAKKTYDTVWGNEDTYLGLTNEYKTLGEMSISGALESAELVDDAVGFIVDGDTFDIHYPISQERLSVRNDTRWHVSKSNGYAISVHTSLNNKDYVEELFIDRDDFDDLHSEPIYQGKAIQLINGCYYWIVIDYMMEKNVGKNKIGRDKYEYRTEEEQYLFYVENTDKEKSATSETKPRQNLGELINTGHDNGFSGDEVIDKDDPHYGWNMGHFFINGYSGKNVTSDGIPIFLKNVGDKVTLWFNLEQSMDTSNPEDSLPLISKEKLALSRDENGYDRAFGTVQTHLGYGALMIQYTDEDGVKHDPVIYNDFLYANTRTGADKRVVLLEEGDYEVHLNYELVRPTTPFTKKYNDYQISFKFRIRNGNCMAYPFDIDTKNELRDNSITESGFKLDLAKSRYLNINVKYETVVADSDGRYSTDIRYNRPANEGMEYTEPGIYTFDITNTNTNPVQHTTKTIFVGNDSILFALANSGKTLKELNDLIAQGYKISRDGSVMNPGCETYPFDISNGADLKDGAITASGFELDLSKSQYLNIDVVYSALSINADGTGKIQSVYNVTSKEGRKYVDPGIYTINATNTKTDPEQHTSKIIYVGNTAFLRALANSGKTIDEINHLLKKGYKIYEDGNIAESDETMGYQPNDDQNEVSVQSYGDTEKNLEGKTGGANNVETSDENMDTANIVQIVIDFINPLNNRSVLIVIAAIISLVVINGYMGWRRKKKEDASDLG